MNRVVFAVALIGCVVVSACGSKSCKDFCSKPCSGTTADCDAACDKVVPLNSASGCSSKYDAFLSCASGLSDADRCSANNTACSTQSADWSTCVVDFCISNPTSSACQAPDGGP